MSRFFWVLFPPLFSVFSAPVGAGSKCAENSTHSQCRNKVSPSQPQQHQIRSWDEVAAYAKNPEVRQNVSHRDVCSADEYYVLIRNEGGQGNWCKQYKDKNDVGWVIVYDPIHRRNVKLIRLYDMAKVEFNTSDKVVSDTTGTKQTRQAKQENPESTKSAEGQVPQVDPADIARKALGTLFKGF